MTLFSGLVVPVINETTVYAEPNNATTQDVDVNEDITTSTTTGSSGSDGCKNSLGPLGWLVCPATGKIAEAVDWLYDKIEEFLVINPVEGEDGTPIYEIWKYCRGVTNIVFSIFLLVVIYSQITGYGISNYGIKKALPKLIVGAVLVNLSFLICTIAVDLSNIIGNSLRGIFVSVEESVMIGGTSGVTAASKISYASLYSSLAGGAALAIGAGVIAFETGAIWMLIPTILGAIVAVASGLITIALRQAVVALLIMISPLAFVSYILPNTESWFKKWKDLFKKMLVFYPMFSLLFGASQLAGFAIIASAKDGFGLLLGLAVQIFPLFFSWKLMTMSGTFLSDINAKLRGLAAKPLATNRAWADSHRALSKQRSLASTRPYTPSLRLMQFISNRRVARAAELSENEELAKNRGLAYRAQRNYRRNGTPTKLGERSYNNQALNGRYQEVILRNKDNMEKGLGQLEAVKQHSSTAQKIRLDKLDAKNVVAFDRLKAEQVRSEKIAYENAMGFHRRMEDAVNAHMDDKNKYTYNSKGERVINGKYKMHEIDDRASARARYTSMSEIMEGNTKDVHMVAANAAQSYDTQKKIIESKMGKYFELTPPTKDVEYRLKELTVLNGDELKNGKKAADSIDLILPGLRTLNQRGDTDLVKEQIDNILSKKIGGGIELGTHASQALASFLMFEVKDNDPFLRRFGKYINLETARAYNSNDRKVLDVTYDEYVKGYHDGEVVTKDNPTGRMFAKKGMKQLVEGTSLDNIERTALSNLDESLKQAYGYDKSQPTKSWDIDGWLTKRKEIQTAFEPAFLSASLKWLSGSEQINSGVKFWTGYEMKQKKDSTGNVIVDKYGDPEYTMTPVWEGEEFAGHRKKVKDYFQDRTMAFFKDQTTGQILGMRTDYRDSTMEHLLSQYLSADSDEELANERNMEYKKAEAEIQTRYGDLNKDEAEERRKADLKALKMELAGRQLRKILGETGKLKQIYRTRTSGTAINAKDWLRRWVNLDDEDALLKEKNYYDELLKSKKKHDGDVDSSDSVEAKGGIYSDSDREMFLNEMQNLKDRTMDDEKMVFFEETRGQLEDWFGENTTIVKKYEKYYKEDNPHADNLDLYKYVVELLEDMDNYPDA